MIPWAAWIASFRSCSKSRKGKACGCFAIRKSPSSLNPTISVGWGTGLAENAKLRESFGERRLLQFGAITLLFRKAFGRGGHISGQLKSLAERAVRPEVEQLVDDAFLWIEIRGCLRSRLQGDQVPGIKQTVAVAMQRQSVEIDQRDVPL